MKFLLPSVLTLFLVSDAPAQTPILELDQLVAGQVTTFTVRNCTPGGTVSVAWTRSGLGSSPTPCGNADLNSPLNLLPEVYASQAGVATLTALVPSTAGGVSVWFHALDWSSCQFSNVVEDTVSPPLPDLVPTDLQTSTCTVLVGGDLQIDYTIQNATSIDCPPFSANLYLSTDSVIEPTQDQFLESINLGSLPGNGTHHGNVSVSIPANQATGNYYLGIYVDPTNLILEADEFNNDLLDQACSSLTVENLIVLEAVDSGTVSQNKPDTVCFPLLSGGSTDYVGLGDDIDGYTTGNPWGLMACLARWDTSSPGIPPGASVQSVEGFLPLSNYDVSLLGMTVLIRPITGAWTGSTVTWNSLPPLDNSTQVSIPFGNTGGGLTFDATGFWNYWQSNPNYGLHFIMNNPPPPANACALLRSHLYTANPPALRVYLN
ncbi:MAG: hypothetical protein DWQ01_11115 [Planctomycetota bacterium]|nr:MAG: hypothetical protein DWQ01_11115 [Planctomycetota bacterium]